MTGRKTAQTPTPCRLRAGVVDVWSVSLSDHPTRPATVLSDDERALCARLRLPAMRRRYSVAHMRLREIIGAYLDEDPARIELGTGPFGKSHVGGASGLQFSLSHSGEIALVAVTQGSRIGVDVQLMRYLPDLDRVARSSMTEAEQRAWRKVPRGLRASLFFQRWALKEAVAKALGLGLRLPFDRLEVELDDCEGAHLIALDQLGERADAWSLFRLRSLPDHPAALAVDSAGALVRTARWRA